MIFTPSGFFSKLSSKTKQFYFWVTLVAVYFFARLPFLFMPNWNFDEGVYLSIGSDLNNGFTLYSQSWDHKPPILYWVYQFLLKVSSNQYFIFPLVNFFLGLATIVLVYKISHYFFESNSESAKTNPAIEVIPYLVAVVTTFFLAFGFWEAGVFNGENLFVPLVLSAIYLFLYKKGWAWDLVVGLLVSLAIGTKANAVVEFVGFFLGFLLIQSTEIKETMWRYFRIILVFIALVGSLFLSFSWQNQLQFGFDSIFTYNTKYVQSDTKTFATVFGVPVFNGKTNQPDRVGISDMQLRTFLLLVWVVFLAYLTFKSKSKSKIFVYLIWFGFAFYGVTLSGRNYSHYLLQLVPLLAIGFGIIYNQSSRFWGGYSSDFIKNELVSDAGASSGHKTNVLFAPHQATEYSSTSKFVPAFSALLVWAVLVQNIVFIFGAGSGNLSLDVFPLELTYRDFYVNLSSNKVNVWQSEVKKYVYWYYPLDEIITDSKKLTPENGRFWHYSNISSLCYQTQRKCGYTAHLWFHLDDQILAKTISNLESRPPDTIFVDNTIAPKQKIQDFIKSKYRLEKSLPDLFDGKPRYEFWVLN